MSARRSDGNLENFRGRAHSDLFARIGAFMTPQETSLVTALLERLKTTDGQIKDPEAEMLIRQTTAEQADAAYYLAQTVLIQDLSLHCAQSRIAELERNLADAKTAAAPPPSFLHGVLGTDPPPNSRPVGSPTHSSGRDTCAAGIRYRVVGRNGRRRLFTFRGSDCGRGRWRRAAIRGYPVNVWPA